MRKSWSLVFFHSLLCVALWVGCAGEVEPDAPIAHKTFAGTNNWSPVNCPTTNPTVYSVDIGTDKLHPRHIFDDSTWGNYLYANNTWRPWRMLFNNNVRKVSLRFSTFQTEPTWDYLRLWHLYDSEMFSGYVGAHPARPTVGAFGPEYYVNGGYTQPGWFEFTWYANHAVQYWGWHIDALKIHCTSTPYYPVNTFEVAHNFPYEGYFLGDGDVIYMKVRQPAGYSVGLVLWPLEAPTSGADFDIFASSTTTTPSSANHQWYSRYGGTAVDMIEVPSHSSERWIYVAIGSYSGKGRFRFYANVHALNDQTRTVSTDWAPSFEMKNYIKHLLSKTSVALYQATEGRLLVKKWQIHWNEANYGQVRLRRNRSSASHCVTAVDNPATTCWPAVWWDYVELNTKDWCGCAPADTPGTCECADLGDLNVFNKPDDWIESSASSVVLHELGHCDQRMRLRDEYKETHGCGHSIMGKWQSYSANHTDFCMARNGGKDYPKLSGHANAEHNWSCLASKRYPGGQPVPAIPTIHTPDAFYRRDGVGQQIFTGIVTFEEEDH